MGLMWSRIRCRILAWTLWPGSCGQVDGGCHQRVALVSVWQWSSRTVTAPGISVSSCPICTRSCSARCVTIKYSSSSRWIGWLLNTAVHRLVLILPITSVFIAQFRYECLSTSGYSLEANVYIEATELFSMTHCVNTWRIYLIKEYLFCFIVMLTFPCILRTALPLTDYQTMTSYSKTKSKI